MRLRHILRRLLHMPMFTMTVVANLAIGIGANTAIFSVINGILLKPLPYPHPEELVAVDHAAFGENRIKNSGMSPFLYFTYREQGRSFQDIGMWDSETASV